jgi:hypothetical protein
MGSSILHRKKHPSCTQNIVEIHKDARVHFKLFFWILLSRLLLSETNGANHRVRENDRRDKVVVGLVKGM